MATDLKEECERVWNCRVDDPLILQAELSGLWRTRMLTVDVWTEDHELSEGNEDSIRSLCDTLVKNLAFLFPGTSVCVNLTAEDNNDKRQGFWV